MPTIRSNPSTDIAERRVPAGDASLRKRSVLLSAATVAMWIAAVCLLYFGAPFWLSISLGIASAGIAFYDSAYIRYKAGQRLRNQGADV
jgi:uncharacterized membrane protein YjjP (DUF1212 family)